MKVLITGSNGIVGKKLAKQLIHSGKHEVIATSLKPLNLEGAQTFTSDLLMADINGLVEQLRPDILVHCAALSNPDACEVDRFACQRMNTDLTKRIASACEDYGTHLIFLSTDMVFNGDKGNYSETDPTEPVNFYGESKVKAEAAVMKLSTPFTIIRTSLVIGWEPKLSRLNLFTRVVASLKKGKTLTVASDQLNTPTYAEDLAYGIEQIINQGAVGIYHLSGSHSESPAKLAQDIALALNLDTNLIKPVLTKELHQPATRPLKATLNSAKAAHELQFSPNRWDFILDELNRQLSQIP